MLTLLLIKINRFWQLLHLITSTIRTFKWSLFWVSFLKYNTEHFHCEKTFVIIEILVVIFSISVSEIKREFNIKKIIQKFFCTAWKSASYQSNSEQFIYIIDNIEPWALQESFEIYALISKNNSNFVILYMKLNWNSHCWYKMSLTGMQQPF